MDERQLSTRRTRLRPLVSDDLADTFALWTDPGVRRYLWDDVAIDEARAAEVLAASIEHFDRHGFGLWAVCDPTSTELMGVCGFRPTASGQPEFLFAFWPRHWGRGLAGEAGRAVIDFVFDVLDRPEIVAATDGPNVASARALERLGMRFERRGRLNGLDTLFYRLKREDRPAKTAARSERAG